jgi:hypothetical protein
MKKKKFTHGITFFTIPEMFEAVRNVSDELEVGVSDFMRQLVEHYFKTRSTKDEAKSNVKKDCLPDQEDDHGLLSGT